MLQTIWNIKQLTFLAFMTRWGKGVGWEGCERGSPLCSRSSLQEAQVAKPDLAEEGPYKTAQNGMHSHLWVQVHVEIFIWNEFWLISTWTEGENHSSMCLYLLICIKDIPSIWVITWKKILLRNACQGYRLTKKVNLPYPRREGKFVAMTCVISLQP